MTVQWPFYECNAYWSVRIFGLFFEGSTRVNVSHFEAWRRILWGFQALNHTLSVRHSSGIFSTDEEIAMSKSVILSLFLWAVGHSPFWAVRTSGVKPRRSIRPPLF